MKIGILTRRYGYNMGSTLQAFAMQELVTSLGHDVEIINYDEASVHWKWKIRPFVEHTQYYLHIPPFGKKRDSLYHRIVQEKRFKDFESNYLNLSGKSLSSTQLQSISERYDKIVVGSDQIWNPYLFDTNYLGKFLPIENRNKIVPYAPSIGTSEIKTITEEQIKLLNELSVLSCREQIGAKIINQLTSKTVPVLLDPTLMISKETWDNISANHKVTDIPNEYIVTYFLGETVPQNIIDEMSKKLQLPIVNISLFNWPDRVIAKINTTDVGPGEFLYLIKNASLVLTDSFHSTIFSWLFNKQFTVFERFKNNDKKNQNSRIHNLLSILGCQNKLYNSPQKVENGSFDEMRSRSINFLKMNLK